jgi:hypothetical protein
MNEWMTSEEWFWQSAEDLMTHWLGDWAAVQKTRQAVAVSTRKYRARRKRR